MQKTKSYWRLVAAAGVVSAFIGSACTVTTGTDVDDDDDVSTAGTGSGTAGSGTAGSGTAGAAAGSAGSGTAGTGGDGPVPYQCDMGDSGAPGTPNTCAPEDPENNCQKCIQAKCCTEYAECYATSPGNQCGWGGPLVDGKQAGELPCVVKCIQDGVAEGTAPDDSDLVSGCASKCATNIDNGASQECGFIFGTQTSFLLTCLEDNCQDDCFQPPK